jgi:cell division transport system ATP-binding protein
MGTNDKKTPIRKNMIFFDHVTKKYSNGVEAIKDLSFEIEKGEFVYLMGSSGAGKSTLIKLIMKEEKPTSGRIIVNARFLHKIRRSGIQKYKRNIGVVFQDFKLLKNKTVFENVAFAVEILGMRRSEINERVMAALELMGLAAKKNEYPQRLSGGEQQRVALARAIVNGPEILIADEPTGNLDPANSKEIMDMLMMINSRGTTVLIATHEKSLVQEYHKRIIQLDHGHDISDVPFEETPFTSHEESKEV